MKDNDLNLARPGEDEIVDIRPDSPFPVTDEEKIKFREDLIAKFENVEMADSTRHHFLMFGKLYQMEMMSRLSADNALSNQKLVYDAFNKNFPSIKVEDFIKDDSIVCENEHRKALRVFDSGDIDLSQFADFEKGFDLICREPFMKMMTAAEQHFNRSCRLLEDIEKLRADESKPEAERVADGQVLLQDLINLHRGAAGNERNYY